MSLKSEKCESFHRFFSNRDSGKPHQRHWWDHLSCFSREGFFPVRCRDGIFKISGSSQAGSQCSPTLSLCRAASNRQQQIDTVMKKRKMCGSVASLDQFCCCNHFHVQSCFVQSVISMCNHFDVSHHHVRFSGHFSGWHLRMAQFASSICQLKSTQACCFHLSQVIQFFHML